MLALKICRAGSREEKMAINRKQARTSWYPQRKLDPITCQSLVPLTLMIAVSQKKPDLSLQSEACTSPT